MHIRVNGSQKSLMIEDPPGPFQSYEVQDTRVLPRAWTLSRTITSYQVRQGNRQHQFFSPTLSLFFQLLFVPHFFLSFIGIQPPMMMIAFITVNSSLVPLIEALCASNPSEFELSGF